MNETIVQKIIGFKQQNSVPYLASSTQTATDMDVFPYPRFYRGDYRSPVASVFEREAGWRPREQKCYNEQSMVKYDNFYPNHCFQAAPSTTYPCYPEYLRKYSDKQAMDNQLFRTSVTEYR